MGGGGGGGRGFELAAELPSRDGVVTLVGLCLPIALFLSKSHSLARHFILVANSVRSPFTVTLKNMDSLFLSVFDALGIRITLNVSLLFSIAIKLVAKSGVI